MIGHLLPFKSRKEDAFFTSIMCASVYDEELNGGDSCVYIFQ